MTLPILHVLIFVCFLIACHSSILHDVPAPSSITTTSASAVQHRSHQRHRHQDSDHQVKQKETSIKVTDVEGNDEDIVQGDEHTPRSDDDIVSGSLLPPRDGQGIRQVEGGNPSPMKEESPLARGVQMSNNPVSITTRPAVGVSGHAEDGSRHSPEYAEPPPESPGFIERSNERLEKPAGIVQLTSKQPPSSVVSFPTPSPQSLKALINKEQDDLQQVVNEVPEKTTQTPQKDIPTNVTKDDSMIRDEASLETFSDSSEEKEANRPRSRHRFRHNGGHDKNDESRTQSSHQLLKDNSSRNRPKDAQSMMTPMPEAESESSVDRHSVPLPGSPSEPSPVQGQWSNNRSRQKMTGQSSSEYKHSSLPGLLKPKEKSGSDLPKRIKEGEASNKPHGGKKKKDQQGMVQERRVKKWKSKKDRKLAKGCPGCSPMEIKLTEAREMHKQVLKAQLLDKLRLVPTFQSQPWPPKLPKQVFPEEAQRDQSLYEDRYYARPTQVLLFGRDLGPRHRLKRPSTGSYKFIVRGKVKGRVGSARLWVYKMKDANDHHGQTLVVTQLHVAGRRRLRERSLVARIETRVREGWVSFDVTHLAQKWVENESQAVPSSQHLLAIRCKTCHRTNYRAIFGVKSNFRPLLEIKESSARRETPPREKRSACDPTNGCCKFDLIVSFEELGVHEIFQPRVIKADYCYGTCERPDASYYNHTMVIQSMRYNSHFHNATLRERVLPCCVPVVLREATIYHYLNSGLDTQVSLVPNLLVERCGCA